MDYLIANILQGFVYAAAALAAAGAVVSLIAFHLFKQPITINPIREAGATSTRLKLFYACLVSLACGLLLATIAADAYNVVVYYWSTIGPYQYFKAFMVLFVVGGWCWLGIQERSLTLGRKDLVAEGVKWVRLAFELGLNSVRDYIKDYGKPRKTGLHAVAKSDVSAAKGGRKAAGDGGRAAAKGGRQAAEEGGRKATEKSKR